MAGAAMKLYDLGVPQQNKNETFATVQVTGSKTAFPPAMNCNGSSLLNGAVMLGSESLSPAAAATVQLSLSYPISFITIAATGTGTVNLPTPSAGTDAAGMVKDVLVIAAGGGTLAITNTVGAFINGSTTLSMTTVGQSQRFIWTGTKWATHGGGGFTI